jgi:3-hydroxyisobutyrate dehydrogenase-like beta-hydroxyacid dehydrogenase
MILSFIESLSEAFTMLEKGGIAPEIASEVWGNSLFDMMIMKTYGPMLAKRNFEAGGFALDLGLKDIRLLQDCVDKSKARMPLLTDLHEKLVESMKRGRAKFDGASIALITRERAGLK